MAAIFSANTVHATLIECHGETAKRKHVGSFPPAGYIQWMSRANFDQALLICQRQRSRVELDAARDWGAGDGGLAAFKELGVRLEEQRGDPRKGSRIETTK